MEVILQQKVDDILSHILKVDPIQEALYNVLDINQCEKTNNLAITKIRTELQAIFSEESITAIKTQLSNDENNQTTAQRPQEQSKPFSEQVQEVAVECILTSLMQRNNYAQAELIASLLRFLATEKIVCPKTICITILKSKYLRPDIPVFWLCAFRLIKLIIPLVGYKGVREVMKTCLENARLLSLHICHSQIPQANALLDLLQLIFDRRASLLPGYFIVTELFKYYPDYKSNALDAKGWPHWRLSKMLTSFVEDCRKPAQMLSLIGRSRLKPIVEYSGHCCPSLDSWKLDNSGRFLLMGTLPYSNDLKAPQKDLLQHIIKQPFSREMLKEIVDFKSRCIFLEEQLVEILLDCVEECATSSSTNTTAGGGSGETSSGKLPKTAGVGAMADMPTGTTTGSPSQSTTETVLSCTCTHLATLLSNIVRWHDGYESQNTSFNNIVITIQARIVHRKTAREGRDHLMWVLLQYISYVFNVPNIHKVRALDFLPVIRLIEFLYPDQEALPAPDCSDSKSAIQLAPISILTHIMKKAQLENLKVPQILPPAFTLHHEMLQSLCHMSSFPNSPSPTNKTGLILNAFSSNQDMYQRPLISLCEFLQGSAKTTVPMPGTNCVAMGSITPFSMDFIDSLTLTAKKYIFSNIQQYIRGYKSNVALSPALVETYPRLSVHMDSGDNLITPLIMNAYKMQSWGIFYTLLEMFTHRFHYIPPQYRIDLLSKIHKMAVHISANSTQLHLCLENTALRLITGFSNQEIIFTMMRGSPADAKNIVSTESEELNRVLVLTVARAIQVTGPPSDETMAWCREFLKDVMSRTPHNWADHTLQCFPHTIEEFYKQNAVSRETHNLKEAVEEEYRKWKSMSNENDIIAHFSIQPQHSTLNLFLCLIFKMVFETERVPVEAYKVLERLDARQLMAHVRTLCDFLVLEFSNSALGQHITKCVDTMNKVMWKFNIVPIDRLILCLALRAKEASSEDKVCLFIIQLLLLRPTDFKNRFQEFVTENSPEHWKQTNWHEKHMAFHRKYPEKFSPEANLGAQSTHTMQLPVYYSNVGLRFMPVLDIIIHRFLEYHRKHYKRLGVETVLEQLGFLYKFYDKPITYLYNTLHYYEERLRESPNLKRHLVQAVLMSQKTVKPPGWALTEEYIAYLTQKEEPSFNHGIPYYMSLIKRFVNTLEGKGSQCPFPPMDWRFYEFPNVSTHALYVTCVEIMALPFPPEAVANDLCDAVIKFHYELSPSEVYKWINAIGMILAWLPKSYWNVLHTRFEQMLQLPELSSPSETTLDPFTLMDLEQLLPAHCECGPALTMAMLHSFYNHTYFDQLNHIKNCLLKERILPIMKTEEQLIVVYHLVGPFLREYKPPKIKQMHNITVELYKLLELVDSHVSNMKYADAIADFLYHIKYRFLGDSVKNEAAEVTSILKRPLQKRLRFIANINVEDVDKNLLS